jgi:hypothetical protein
MLYCTAARLAAVILFKMDACVHVPSYGGGPSLPGRSFAACVVMSLVWLELLELMKGRSGVALTQFSSSSSNALTDRAKSPNQCCDVNTTL